MATRTEPNESVLVAMNIVARDGEAEAVAEILERLVAPTLAEEGVRAFRPYRSPEEPNRFFVYELYADRAGCDAHDASPHYLRALEELRPRVTLGERVPFLPVPG